MHTMYLNARLWTIASGLSWLIMGFVLTIKGLKMAPEKNGWIIPLALAVGYLKGQLVLSKSAHRIIHRLAALPPPITLSRVYDTKYLTLLTCMIALGFLCRLLPTTLHAIIDLAIGAALLRSSFCFFYSQTLAQKPQGR